MSNRISAYIYPILKHEDVSFEKHPYIKSYVKLELTMVHDSIMKEFDVTENYYYVKNRKVTNVDARKILSVILKQEFKWTLDRIGEYMGGRDHTTVINAISTFYDYYKTDDLFKGKSDNVFHSLKKEVLPR